MIKIKCATCNKEFKIFPYRFGVAKYCSNKCSKTVFQKGMTPWLAGTKGLVKPNSGSFKKGQVAWNKGKKGRPSWNKGLKLPQFSGKNNPRWKGGIAIMDGYIYINAPSHPFRSKQNRFALHRLIMEEKINRFLTPDEIVHHINENRQDNRLENLMICTRAEHMHIHRKNLVSHVTP